MEVPEDISGPSWQHLGLSSSMLYKKFGKEEEEEIKPALLVDRCIHLPAVHPCGKVDWADWIIYLSYLIDNLRHSIVGVGLVLSMDVCR